MAASYQLKGGEAVGLTSKGKGTKLMVVVEGQGIPIGVYLDGPQQDEINLP